MTHIPRDMSEVHAPDTALAWAASYGWIRDAIDLEHARERGDDVVLVDDDQWVRNLTGPAPLAALVRADREVQELIDWLLDFLDGLTNLAEGTRRR